MPDSNANNGAPRRPRGALFFLIPLLAGAVGTGGWLAFSGCIGGPDPVHEPDFARRIEVDDIDNVGRIHDGLYRGGQPGEAGYAWLKAKGFRTVINLRTHHGEEEAVRKHGMEPVEFKVKADVFGSEPPTEEQIRAFFDVVLDPARQPVYFHCLHGADRTGTMAAIYRIEVEGWAPEKAIREMQVFGYHDYYKDLIEFVRSYRPRGYKAPLKPE